MLTEYRDTLARSISQCGVAQYSDSLMPGLRGAQRERCSRYHGKNGAQRIHVSRRVTRSHAATLVSGARWCCRRAFTIRDYNPYRVGRALVLLGHRRRAAMATVEPPQVVRRAVHRKANLKQVEEGVLPEGDTGDRQQFLFFKDKGGLRVTDEQKV